MMCSLLRAVNDDDDDDDDDDDGSNSSGGGSIGGDSSGEGLVKSPLLPVATKAEVVSGEVMFDADDT